MPEISIQKAVETLEAASLAAAKAPKKRRSYYRRNPWLEFEPHSSEEWKDMCQACYKLYHTAQFPVLVDDAVDFILQNLENRKDFEESQIFRDPKIIIGRWLAENFLIRGRQLRRNGSRSRFYVITKLSATAEAVSFYGSTIGLEE